ncbi:MAG: acyl-CoA dehydrogenase family protein [Lacisediminihabitans sp.]
MSHELTPTLSYGLTEDEQALADMVKDFAETVIAPASYEADRDHRLPMNIVAQMGEMGLFGLPVSEDEGGQGGSFLALCLAIEAIARVDQSLAITLEAAVGLGILPLYRHGTDEQKAKWLPDLVAGRALAGFGLTEAEAGSDAGGTRTTARLDGDEWVINGSKQFITNSGTPISSFVSVAAVTGERTRADGSVAKEISTIIVPHGTPGFTVEPAYDKVGWWASDTHPLTFDEVRVPAANLLGERGRGFANFLEALDEGRVAIAALATGAAEGCLAEAISYAKSRVVFGVPIASHQYIAFTIAKMRARVYTSRLAWYDAARRCDAGLPFKAEAAMAKLVASDAAMQNARDATQIFGGYGFMNESLVGRHYRDSKILEIGEGTNEVQLMVIARSLGLGAAHGTTPAKVK